MADADPKPAPQAGERTRLDDAREWRADGQLLTG